MISHTPNRHRSLSHDERKAAEAAFQGRPFNETWSASARTVYEGILAATRKLQSPQGCAPVTALVPVEDETPAYAGAVSSDEGD